LIEDKIFHIIKDKFYNEEVAYLSTTHLNYYVAISTKLDFQIGAAYFRNRLNALVERGLVKRGDMSTKSKIYWELVTGSVNDV